MSKSIVSFEQFNDDKSARYLANHYPTGKLTGKRFNITSILYKFILCIATFIKVTIGNVFILAKNRDINQVDELITEWETSVKIPEIYPRTDTIEKRRLAIERLISKIPVYNMDTLGVDIDTTFQNHVSVLTGIDDIEITTLGETTGIPVDYFHFIVLVPQSAGVPNLFPFFFPITFGSETLGSGLANLINTILDNIVPSFCRWTISIKSDTNNVVTSSGNSVVTSTGNQVVKNA